jgi:PAS domain S-box-containing protein
MAKIGKKEKIKSVDNPSLLKIKLKSAKEVGEFAENIINTVREPLIALDKDLRVVKASRSFYDFFKVTSDETIGKLIYNLGNNQWDIPKLRELLETILPEKTTFDNFEVEHVFSTIGKRIMLLNARKIQRGSGKEQIILLAIEDITIRKLAEEALAISETRYRGLFESAKDGILILDSETGRIVDVNPILINMLGYSKEQFINKTIWEIGIFKDIVADQENYIEFQKKGYNRYEHLPLETKDGRRIDIEFVSHVNIAHQQKVTQCNIRDITERIKHEQIHKEEMDKKEALLKEIQHRTKNTFNMITSLIHLRSSVTHSEKTKIILDDLTSRVKSISDLYSLLYETQSFYEVELKTYCDKVIDSMLNLSKNITLNKYLEKITVSSTNAATIGMILVELLSNIVKYAFPDSQKGTISIELKEINSQIVLIVEDNGIGLQNAFDINKVKSIGLHLVNLMVSQLDGKIQFISEKGTKIVIEFPLFSRQ